MSDQLIFSEDADQPEKKGGRVVALVLLLLVLIVAAAYVWAWSQAEDGVPRGTTIEGVSVGGQSRSEAIATLKDELGGKASRAMDLQLGDRTASLVPADAGLSVDYAASVDAVGSERSWSPAWLWAYYTDGSNEDAVVTEDSDALDDELRRLAKPVERKPVEGAIAFKQGEAKVTEAKNGRELDVSAARDAVLAAYLSDDTVQAPLRTVEPEITGGELRQAQRAWANPATSGPITLRFGQSSVRLTPEEYLPAVKIAESDGALALQVDRKRLFGVVDEHVSGEGTPQDAQVVLQDGRPQIIPAKTGVTYKKDPLVRRFRAAITAQGEGRSRKVGTTVAQPEFTTADARKLGIKQQVSTFTTYYPHANYRNVNLSRAAELIDGTVLKPGETFSLNDTVGERTVANGFTEGYIISNGILTGDLGGGVSQMATTLFNAAFFAGLKDVEHKPHSFYIDRYPVGREATVAWGSVDLKFKNDTPYGILIDASVSPSSYSSSGAVTVSMYSTKYWDITTRTGERYNFTSPQTREIDSATCTPNTGYGGFDIDVWRYFRKAGSDELVKTEKMHTTYTPSDTVVCTNPHASSGVS